MHVLRAIPVVVLLALLAAPRETAPAGVPLVDGAGTLYRWDLANEQPNVTGGKVTFYPHPGSLRDTVVGQSTPIAAIRAGVREWEIGTTSIAFQEDTSRPASGPNGGDRVNWIGWVGGGLDTFVLAVTTVTRDGTKITDMDVSMNDRDWPWDTFTPGRAGIVDIEGLVAHEWGHALGCDHVPLRTSTMYAFTRPGIVSLRTLAPDDRALVGSIYPNAVFGDTTGAISGAVDVAGTANDRAVHVVAVSVASGEPEASTLTAPDGTYRIDGLPAGVYRIVAAPTVPLAESMNPFWTSGSTSFLPSVLTEDGASPGPLRPLAVAAGQTVTAPLLAVANAASPFEPNDSAVQATPIEIGDALAARFESGGDEDWYSFTGAAGMRISVSVLSWGLGADADPGLRIVSAAGGTVLLQDDVRPAQIHGAQPLGEDLDVRVAGFELPQSGQYFLRVRDQISTSPKGSAFYALLLTPASDAPSSALTTVTATPDRIDAGGATTASIVVRPRRETGEDIGAGQTVSLSHTGAGSLGTVTDQGDGTYRALVTSAAVPGDDRVTVTVATPEGTATILDAVTLVYLGPADAARSALAVSPRRIDAGVPAQAAVLLTPRDARGEALGRGRSVVLTLTAPAGAALLGPVDLGDGSYADTVTGTTQRGDGTVSASVDGVSLGAGVRVSFGFGLTEVLTDAIADVQAFIATEGVSKKAGRAFAKAQSAASDAVSDLAGASPGARDRAVAAAQRVLSQVAAGLKKAGVPLADPGTRRDLAQAIREAAAQAVAAAVPTKPRDQRKIDAASADLAAGDAAMADADEAAAASKWRRAYDRVRPLQPR